MSYHNYSFAYFTKDNDDIGDEFPIEDNLIRNLKYSDAITWQPVLRDFLSFLSGIYGYDIGKQVKFETFDEKMARIREENNLNSDWPWDDEEESLDDEGEEAPKV